MFATVWAYKSSAEHRAAFLEAYGADGQWARLFRSHPGYIKTVLYEDVAAPNHFMSADIWRSKADFDTFQQMHGGDYEALDREMAHLSVQSHYGFFDNVKDYAPLVFDAAGVSTGCA